MKRRDLILLALLAIIAATALLVTVRRDQPYLYAGKNSWQWANDLQSPVPGARETAQIALTEMGSNAVPRLVKQLEYQEPFHRKCRVWLGEHLPGRLGAAFLQNFKPASIGNIHSVAASGLEIVGTNAAAATPALCHAMRTDSDAQVTWNSAKALRKIGAPAVPGLIELLQDSNPTVRHAAAYALGEIGPPALPATSALIRAAADPNPNIRNSALYALMRLGPDAATTALKMTTENRGELRRAAARALVSTHPAGKWAMPVLVEMAQNSDPASRAVAIESLAALHISHSNAVAVYVAGLTASNAAVRAASASAFITLPHKADIAAPTLEYLKDNDADASVRIAAAEALSRIAELKSPTAKQ